MKLICNPDREESAGKPTNGEAQLPNGKPIGKPIITDRELMQQALEAFRGLLTFNSSPAEYKQGRDVVAALRDRLAQPKTPEVTPEVKPYVIDCPRCGHCCPQWVGLTMEDMAELRRSGLHEISDKHFQAIEAKLREKNT